METVNFGKMVLKMGIRLIFLILIVSFLKNDSANSNDIFKIQKKFQIDESNNTIIIINSSEKEAIFSLKINQFFPLSFEEIDREIVRFSKLNGISYLKSACLFVHRNTFSGNAISTENWQHQAELFLNSLGSGLCDDKASVLAYILKKKGFSVKIINLNGHIVTTVLEKSKWKLLDSELGLYFCNNNKDLMSVDEIIADSNSILLGLSTTDSLINPFFHFKSSQIRNYLYFLRTDDNKEETSWHIPSYANDSTICLPSKSKLFITFDKSCNLADIYVELSPMSRGMLSFPFVLSNLSGNFFYNDLNKKSNLTSKKLALNKKHKLFVSKTTTTSKLSFFVNRKLNFFKKSNSIKINSKNKALQVITQYKKNPVATNFLSKYYYYDALFLNHKSYIFHLKLRESDIHFNIENLKREYSNFLDSDKNLKDDEKIRYLSLFEMQFSEWNNYFRKKNTQISKIVLKENSYFLYWFFLTFKRNDKLFFESVFKSI